MSQPGQVSPNHQRILALYAAYAAGQRAAFHDILAPDITWYSAGPPDLPWAGARTGRDAVHAYFDILSVHSDVEGYTPEHSVEQGEWLILLGTLRVRVRSNGIAEDYRKVDAFRFKDGRIAEFREYYDTASALAHFNRAPAD